MLTYGLLVNFVVKQFKIKQCRFFKSKENIHRNKDGFDRTVSINTFLSVILYNWH